MPPPLSFNDMDIWTPSSTTFPFSRFLSSLRSILVLLALSSSPSPLLVAPSHLSSLHLPATNHNLFTTPRAHSTTLLAPIADLFIPDNAEGWRLWFETRFAECISHGLTAWAPHSLGLIDVILSRAELFRAASVKCGWDLFFKPCKEMTKKGRYSVKGFTVNLAAWRDERQQVAHLLMVEKAAVGLLICLWGWVGWTSAYLTFSRWLSQLLWISFASMKAQTLGDDKSLCSVITNLAATTDCDLAPKWHHDLLKKKKKTLTG